MPRPKEVDKYTIEHYLEPEYEYVAVFKRVGGGGNKVVNTFYGEDCKEFMKLLTK